MPTSALSYRMLRPDRPPARPAFVAAVDAAGTDYSKLARRVGAHRDTVSRIAHGSVQPSAALRQRIADILGVSDVDSLFALSGRSSGCSTTPVPPDPDKPPATAARLVAVIAGSER